MFIPDDEKEGREEALDKLISMMSDEAGKKLHGLKKPAVASMTIEKVPSASMGGEVDRWKSNDDKDDDADISPGFGLGDDQDGDMDNDDLDESDKDKIRMLYNKYC